jgi:hypothetical protein
MSPREANDVIEQLPTIQAFIQNPSFSVANQPEKIKTTVIDFTDPLLELVPEAYLDSRSYTVKEIADSVDHLIRSTIGFLLTHNMERGVPTRSQTELMVSGRRQLQNVPITEICEIESGEYHNASLFEKGSTPLVSCGDTENGVVSWIIPETKATLYSNAVTVAYNGQPLTTKFHPYKFITKDDVAICLPKQGISFETMMLASAMLYLEQWRYSYGRKCFREKLKRLSIPMPITKSGLIDHEWISAFMRSHPYWDYFQSQRIT